jgi:MFS family permease
MTPSYRWTIFVICWLAGAFAGMDATLFTVVMPQAVGEVAATIDRNTISSLSSYILSTFLAGWMCGGIFFGYLSDRTGRVKSMAVSVLLYTLFTGVTAFVSTPWALGICRFVIGLGVGGTMLGISIFLAENWPERSKALALGALITSDQVGVFLSGAVANLFPSWRMAFAIGAVPAVLGGIILMYFREPAMSGNKGEASSEPRRLLLGSVIFGSLLIGYWASATWIPTWIQDLVGPASHGLEKTRATMVHGICAILGCLAAGKWADSWGRRPVLSITFFGALVTSLTMFLWFKTFSAAIYLTHGALGFFVGVLQAVLYIYLPELFPQALRGRLVGFCLNAGRVFTAAAVLFMGALVAWLGGYEISLSIFSLTYLVGGILIWKLPETAPKKILESA